MSLYSVFVGGSYFLRIISTAIFIYAILSWFRPSFRAYDWLTSFVSPFLQPFRRLSYWLMNKTRIPLDFTCWFAIIGVEIVEFFWMRLYYLLRLIR